MSIESLTKPELLKVAEALEELKGRYKYNKLEFIFPETGQHRRELYPKHIEFMNAGSKYAERMFSAGNQTGKTSTILTEAVYHLTGKYPAWFTGKRFRNPTVGIIGCKSWKMARNSLQAKLLGDAEEGTGIIPKNVILNKLAASGTAGAYEVIFIRHVTGGISKLIFNTYEAGKDSWESITVDFVFLDEEPPLDIYTEAAMRTLAKDGTIAIGFTPDSGLTETVLQFFKDGDFSKGVKDGKYIAMVGWNDVPHLSESRKAALLSTIPDYLKEAKVNGIPYLGTGRIFPFDIYQFLVDPIQIPEQWPRWFGFDVGIKNTAAIWIAYDDNSETYYVYDEYYSHDQLPPLHASALKAKGNWIHGVMDPYAGVNRSGEGRRFIDIYQQEGLYVQLVERNFIESGIEKLKTLFINHKIKIFKHCEKLVGQMNIWHRNEKNKIADTPDDLIDALRYAITDGKQFGISHEEYQQSLYDDQQPIKRLARDSITGY
jgi:phage terminase large subunit-like protein